MKTKSNFRARVLAVVKRIRKGKTLSYGEVARRAGNAGAARAVGSIMRSNKNTDIPCHRVVAKHFLGGYNGLLGSKRAILLREGVRQ